MARANESARLLGQALRRLRKAAKIGREEAARSVGVSLRTLDDDERGDARAGVPCVRLDDYARLYGVEPRAVLGAASSGSD